MAGFVLPPRSAVGHLDAEIANEGVKVFEDAPLGWNPPPAKIATPDWSEIKQIRHYFNRTGYQVFPAWLYHKDGESRLVKDADEAKEIGVIYRHATDEEKGRYGVQAVWDWTDGCLWRPKPWGLAKFDPKNPGMGKEVIPEKPDPMATQAELLRGLLKAFESGGVQKPSDMNDKDWVEFQQFLTFKKAQAEIAKASEPDPRQSNLSLGAAENALASFADDAARAASDKAAKPAHKR